MGGSYTLGFEFGPPCIESIESLLRLLHGQQRCLQPYRIGGHRRIFDHCALSGDGFLGRCHSILNAGKLARFQIRELLSCRWSFAFPAEQSA